MLIQILNGIVYGGLLYLLAVGLVLIFGLREVVNFAHGALFMVGAYIGFSVAAAGILVGRIARFGGGRWQLSAARWTRRCFVRCANKIPW